MWRLSSTLARYVWAAPRVCGILGFAFASQRLLCGESNKLNGPARVSAGRGNRATSKLRWAKKKAAPSFCSAFVHYIYACMEQQNAPCTCKSARTKRVPRNKNQNPSTAASKSSPLVQHTRSSRLELSPHHARAKGLAGGVGDQTEHPFSDKYAPLISGGNRPCAFPAVPLLLAALSAAHAGSIFLSATTPGGDGGGCFWSSPAAASARDACFRSSAALLLDTAPSMSAPLTPLLPPPTLLRPLSVTGKASPRSSVISPAAASGDAPSRKPRTSFFPVACGARY